MAPVLPDVLAPGLKVVFCGSAAGAASARRNAYYAGPGNRFWPALAEVGLTPKLRPEDFPSVIQYGLGLTDLAKDIAGADSILREHHFDRAGLKAKILQYQPRVLAFTSKRAAQEYLQRPTGYGCIDEAIGETRICVLPSPSGAARGYWNIDPWQGLAAMVGVGFP